MELQTSNLLTPLAQLMRLQVWNGAPNLRFVNTSRSIDHITGLEWNSQPQIR